MAIISVLTVMAMPLAELAAKRTKERELKLVLWEIRSAIDRYKHAYDEGRIAPRAGATGYPPSLNDLVLTTTDAKTGAPMHFLRRIPRDPFNQESVDQAVTWGLRSYASPAAAPKSGADVYDVYSKSDAVGFNGLIYSRW